MGLSSLSQTAFSLRLDFSDAFKAVIHHATVIQIASDNQTCSTCSSMTMHENTLAHLVESTHVLHDHENFLFIRASQIFPIPVESGNSVRLEFLWIVAEADFIIDTVGAERMFTRLLQVNYHAHF